MFNVFKYFNNIPEITSLNSISILFFSFSIMYFRIHIHSLVSLMISWIHFTSNHINFNCFQRRIRMMELFLLLLCLRDECSFLTHALKFFETFLYFIFVHNDSNFYFLRKSQVRKFNTWNKKESKWTSEQKSFKINFSSSKSDGSQRKWNEIK